MTPSLISQDFSPCLKLATSLAGCVQALQMSLDHARGGYNEIHTDAHLRNALSWMGAIAEESNALNAELQRLIAGR